MSHPDPHAPRVVVDAGEAELSKLIREAIGAIDRLLVGEPKFDDTGAGFGRSLRGQLAILRALLGMQRPLIEPELAHTAPLGFVYGSVERELGLELGRGVDTLESLADLGLLERELHGKVQVCPRCRHFQVDYRETCVGCASIDIEIERLVHHFHCAYTGLESEFQQGLDLSCPRCRRKLFQLGQDFEWPHDTYVCHDCHRIFEEPVLHALCTFCAHEFLGKDSEPVKIWRYAPTPLAVRAVELNRLTGLDVSEIMFDTRVRLATRDFLALELERETHRARRYNTAFSAVLLTFEHSGRAYEFARDWSAETIRELASMLTGALRPLDLVARVGVSCLALLLPETDAKGAGSVEQRLLGILDASHLTTRAGRPLVPVWRVRTWQGEQASHEEAMAFFLQDEAAL